MNINNWMYDKIQINNHTSNNNLTAKYNKLEYTIYKM